MNADTAACEAAWAKLHHPHSVTKGTEWLSFAAGWYAALRARPELSVTYDPAYVARLEQAAWEAGYDAALRARPEPAGDRVTLATEAIKDAMRWDDLSNPHKLALAAIAATDALAPAPAVWAGDHLEQARKIVGQYAKTFGDAEWTPYLTQDIADALAVLAPAPVVPDRNMLALAIERAEFLDQLPEGNFDKAIGEHVRWAGAAADAVLKLLAAAPAQPAEDARGGDMMATVRALEAQSELLTRRIRGLEEALKFYADEWLSEVETGLHYEPTDALWNDKGQRARAVLQGGSQ